MSGIYAVTKQAMITGAFNWTSSSFSLMLVGPGYTPDYENDATLNDIPGGSQLLESALAISGLTASAGYAMASPASWLSLTTASPVVGVAIVQQNGGDQSTWQLVFYCDQGEGFGQQPSAQPANVIFDNRGLFRP